MRNSGEFLKTVFAGSLLLISGCSLQIRGLQSIADAPAGSSGSSPSGYGRFGSYTELARWAGEDFLPGYAKDGTGSSARFSGLTGAATDGTFLYVSEVYSHTIRKIDVSTGAVTTVAGVAAISGGQDGPAATATFSSPRGLATDGTSLYVADTGNALIRKIDLATGTVSTVAGARLSTGTTDGVGTAARFNQPYGVALAGGNLYVADTGNRTIRKIDLSTSTVSTYAGAAGTTGTTDGIGAAARFHQPYGIATDGTNLFVGEFQRNTIRMIVISSASVTTLAGASSAGSADGTGSSARFYNPQGVATDGTYVYVADTWNNTIRRVTITTGATITLAGRYSAGSDDGTGTSAWFDQPWGLAVLGGSVYIADTYNNTVRALNLSSLAVTTLAGVPHLNSRGYHEDASPSLARMNSPTGMVSDGTFLYFVDAGNHVIRKASLASGATSLVAGMPGAAGSADGTGTAARFNSPRGLTYVSGNLYVVDRGNHSIRRINVASGAVTTFAGTSGVSGSSNGVGAAASFYYPVGIASNGTHLFVGDSWNNVVRRIALSDATVVTFAGTTGSYGTADGAPGTGRLDYPEGVAVDGNYVYTADYGSHLIRRADLATGNLTTLAGGANTAGSTDGVGTAARFQWPNSLAIDATYLYVSDSGNGKVRRITKADGTVVTLAGSGAQGNSDGVGASASLSLAAVAIDSGTVYVSASNNYNNLRKVSPTGVVTTWIGIRQQGGNTNGAADDTRFGCISAMTSIGDKLYSVDSCNHQIRETDIPTRVTSVYAGSGAGAVVDGVGTAASFATPWGIVRVGGDFYVTDSGDCTIRKIDIATKAVTTFAGVAGTCSNSIDGGPGVARLYRPHGLATDGTFLYFTDRFGRVVRKLEIATGTVTTVAGLANTSGIVDATGSAARFSLPTGIAVDGNFLYVRDSTAVRKVDLTTAEVTTAVGLMGTSGFNNGPGTTARLSGAFGNLTVTNGYLLIPDEYNYLVRKYHLTTGEVTTFAGVLGKADDSDGTLAQAGLYRPTCAHEIPGIGTFIAGRYSIRLAR